MDKLERELKCLESASTSSGEPAIEWALEAIALALHRIANALEKENREIKTETTVGGRRGGNTLA